MSGSVSPADGGTTDLPTLRRELWAVLDLEPQTDRDLVETVRNLRSSLASLRRELSESLTAQARLAGAVSSPPLYRRTRPHRPGLLVDPADDLAELDARIATTPADYPGLPYMRRCRDALAELACSVPSETAQTEENETRG